MEDQKTTNTNPASTSLPVQGVSVGAKESGREAVITQSEAKPQVPAELEGVLREVKEFRQLSESDKQAGLSESPSETIPDLESQGRNVILPTPVSRDFSKDAKEGANLPTTWRAVITLFERIKKPLIHKMEEVLSSS